MGHTAPPRAEEHRVEYVDEMCELFKQRAKLKWVLCRSMSVCFE